MDATMQVFKISNTLVCPHPLGLRAWQRATDGALRILLRITRSWRNRKQGREKLEKTSRCLLGPSVHKISEKQLTHHHLAS